MHLRIIAIAAVLCLSVVLVQAGYTRGPVPGPSKSIIYRNIHPLYPAPVSHGLSRIHVVHIHNYRGRGGSSSSKSSKKSRKGKSSGYKKRKYRRYRKYGLRYRRATEDLGGKSSRSSQGY
ncbi:uncharacterized protein LOC128173269 [Crassostrea angulata]|uniref:uncharacterized protein LOC128173269 n=1 Tax=Magallana angulata TaxID=2784310 RepID=UPI0022B08EE0|nr:uncharacterized protein LOC128173269 [Crassostrea angulata]